MFTLLISITPLLHLKSTVHGEDLSGDVIRVSGSEKPNRVSDVLGFSDAFQQDPRSDLSPANSRTVWDISVSITPGATALTRMLRAATSQARDRVNPLIAPLLAA